MAENTKTPETTEAKWYVIHTYSGYENKVKADLEKTVENRQLEDRILELKVPVEDIVEIKNGKKKVVQRKVFPSYVLVKMVVDDETWYVVRNTRGVTSFVGPGSKPIPLSDSEVALMCVDNAPIVLDIEIGQSVTVISGPLESFVGIINEINTDKQKLKVTVNMFGRETPVELDFNQVRPIE